MSTIKVNKIEKRSGSTLTLGGPGTTVTLACGATQSGFGRAGSVNWCSTIYTNSPGTVTATSGKGFFLNTTSGAITINLPSSPSVGDIVAIKDYANTFDSNNVTVGRGGSKIAGLCLDAKLSTEGESITLVYADATKGWLNVNTDSTVVGNEYIIASGGNAVITCGNYKTHIFTASGCFSVTDAGLPSGSTTLEYFVVAGGGGGGGSTPCAGGQGGAGAGGMRLSNSPTSGIAAPVMSPLSNPAGLTASVATYPITVGAGGTAGGTGSPAGATEGSPAVFSTITSAGGGKGGSGACTPTLMGTAGGSGGGGNYSGPYPKTAGAGNTPPVSPPQGNPGGPVTAASDPPGAYGGSGGGGAGAAGGGGDTGPGAFPGGVGSYISDTLIGPTAPSYGTPGPVSSVRYFAGGGGGSNKTPNGPSSPTAPLGGGGGTGGKGAYPGGDAGDAGTANTGGGGGGGIYQGGGTGGSGIVIIRYKFQ